MKMSIPEDHHVSRYCSKQKISDIDGRIQDTAFHLRENDTYLSVNWIEFFKKDNISEAINEIQKIFENKTFTVRASAKFAVLSVGESKDEVRNQTNQIENLVATHEPMLDDPSHSAFHGITQENYRLIAAILAECVKDTYPAKH